MIPGGVVAAVSRAKVRACLLALEQARASGDGVPPTAPGRLWNVFVALGGLPFSEGSAPAPTARRERLRGRPRWILQADGALPGCP
eukprot:8558231-Pyramimonas_sp.AAC.1